MKRPIFLALLSAIILCAAPAQLKIYCMDVNQGSATLFIAPSGKTLLVDAGEAADADEVLEILNREQIRAIDYGVVTHFDDDHFGGFGTLKANGITFRNPIYTYTGGPKGHKDVLPATGKISPDMTIDLGPGVSATCLAANRLVSGGERAKKLKSSNYKENQNSIVLVVAYGDFEVYDGGDVTKQVEQAMVDEGVVPDVDVYLVSHHGSPTSSSEDLVTTLEPEVAIVSNGTKFNHPTAAIVKRLQDRHAKIYQTNKNTSTKSGTKNVDDTFIGDRDPVKDEGTILIEVKGSTYTVSFERDGYQHGTTYPVDR